MEEKYILVGVSVSDEEETENSLAELSALLDTAGGISVLKVIQRLDHPDPATYIGKGKAYEIRDMLEKYEADGIVCDDELTPAQMRNLTDILSAKVIDRTILILDIFASHAVTNEGKIQVEMAQLKYRLSHLTGLGKSLSRLGGGIGTRGPGETKLEIDRRRLNSRIASLSREIKELKQTRETTRKRRLNSNIPILAIVGYTNAGKSSLLNRLTGANVLAEDKLFATLDPVTRNYETVKGRRLLFIDTVGFINKLPHNLIDAFKSTLEEAKYADILVHVIDSSDPELDLHAQVVYKTLKELAISDKPVITVYNKKDLIDTDRAELISLPRDSGRGLSVSVSVKTGEGMENFQAAIEKVLNENMQPVKLLIPYNEGGAVSEIKRNGQVISEEYDEKGIILRVYLPQMFADKYREFDLNGYL
ncbi:MAG: GTPase HflX [Lachnospiraceae bacterium]|nr:GTPase HflX [Lachnospiraceae bacterium]